MLMHALKATRTSVLIRGVSLLGSETSLSGSQMIIELLTPDETAEDSLKPYNRILKDCLQTTAITMRTQQC